MKMSPKKIPEVLLFEPDVYKDERGYFMETFRSSYFSEHGVDLNFVQDNQSQSRAGTLRGLHYQLQFPQGKLVRVMSGEVFDVAVDIRKSSSTFGKWVGETLSAENKKQLWIPPGFAHGFLVLSKSDMAEDSDMVQLTINQLRRKYRFVSWAPIIVTSALHNIGREELLEKAVKIAEQRTKRIETAELNKFINQAVNENPPGLLHNRRLKIYYVTQAEINPPHFIFFVNNTSNIHFSYKRYLENKIRMQYGFDGTAIQMSFKDKDEQEAEQSELLEAAE